MTLDATSGAIGVTGPGQQDEKDLTMRRVLFV